MNTQGYIYKTTNLIDNKIYIGKSLSMNRPSYFGSGLHIKRAIKKYGKENFKREIITYSTDEDKLNKLEIAFITEYRKIFGKDHLYNITNGGEGHRNPHSQKTKIKIGKARKGSKLSKEACINISEGYKKHKSDCKCMACRSRRGDKPKHKKYCMCPFCKAERGRYIHKDNCKCICCRNRKREFIVHKIDCKCASCKGKRGEYKGQNNPMFGKHHTQKTIKMWKKHYLKKDSK